MPRINIWESDQTTPAYTSRGDVVYVPTIDTPPTGLTLDANNCCYFADSSSFAAIVDVSINPTPSAIYIYKILQASLGVVVHYLPATSTSLREALTEADLTFLNDKDVYNIKFLSTGVEPTVKLTAEGLYRLINGVYTYITSESVLEADTYYDITATSYATTPAQSVAKGTVIALEGNTFEAATGTYVDGTTYYTATEVTPAPEEGSDVSSYYILNDSDIYEQAEGTAQSGTKYYTISLATLGSEVFGTNVVNENLYTFEGFNNYAPASYANGTATIHGYVVSGVNYYTINAQVANLELLTGLLNKLSNVAKDRGDCAVISSLNTHGASALKDFKATLDGEPTAPFSLEESLNSNVSRGALFAASMTVEEIQTYPDIAYFERFGAAKLAGKQWEAIAGVARGTLESFDKSAAVSRYELDRNVMADASNEKTGRSFNGIVTLRASNYVVWGDRTLLNNTGDLKATSFLSIRNIISDIAKRAYNQAITYTFETNNEITWANFKNAITELLDQMTQAQVIATSAVIKTPTTARATIACEIHIAPYGPVEDFDIGIVLTPEGLDINVVE